MKIFLSGEVRTDWRDFIIKHFPEHEFYNPKVKNYSIKDKRAERRAIQDSEFVIILLKGRGKGTVGEWRYCMRIKKPHRVFKDVNSIVYYLKGVK